MTLPCGCGRDTFCPTASDLYAAAQAAWTSDGLGLFSAALQVWADHRLKALRTDNEP